METNPGVLNVANDLIEESTDGSAIGKIIWEETFTGEYHASNGGALGFNPIGNWSHPCKMSQTGGVLVVTMQNWSEGNPVETCTGSTSNPYQIGTDQDMLVFYDVRDPQHPKFWGKMTAEQLGFPETGRWNGPERHDHREISAVGLLRSITADEWTLSVYGNKLGRTWKTSFLSPNIEDWTKVSDTGGGGGGQHGGEFNSYQWDSGRKVTVPANGIEQNMTYDAGNVAAGGGERDGFTFGGSGSTDTHNMGPLPGALRRWDANSIYITPQGMPVIYSLQSGGLPDGDRGNNDAYLYQVSDDRNHPITHPLRPVISHVTTLWDSGPGSLRRAIGEPSSILRAGL